MVMSFKHLMGSSPGSNPVTRKNNPGSIDQKEAEKTPSIPAPKQPVESPSFDGDVKADPGAVFKVDPWPDLTKTMLAKNKQNKHPVSSSIPVGPQADKKTEINNKSFPPDREKIADTESLVLSRYCFGCSMFLVDYPFTENEAGFCERVEPDGNVTYKFINKKYLVRNCPLLKRKRKYERVAR